MGSRAGLNLLLILVSDGTRTHIPLLQWLGCWTSNSKISPIVRYQHMLGWSTPKPEVVFSSETSLHVGLHDALSQKIAIFIMSAVST
jgi:hypothetical protein